MKKIGNYSYVWRVVPISIYKTTVVIDKIRFREKDNVVENPINQIGDSKLLLQMRTVAENAEFSTPSAIYRIEVKV